MCLCVYSGTTSLLFFEVPLPILFLPQTSSYPQGTCARRFLFNIGVWNWEVTRRSSKTVLHAAATTTTGTLCIDRMQIFYNCVSLRTRPRERLTVSLFEQHKLFHNNILQVRRHECVTLISPASTRRCGFLSTGEYWITSLNSQHIEIQSKHLLISLSHNYL